MAIKLEDIIVDSGGSEFATDQSQGLFNEEIAVFRSTVDYSNIQQGRSANEVASKIRSYQLENRGSNVLYFPNERIKYYVSLQYSKYLRLGGGANLLRSRFKRIGSIYLPLPTQGITDTYDIDYIEREMGLIGAAASTAQDVFNDPNSANFGNALQIAGEAITRQAADVVPAFAGILGVTPNKFMTILLKGPRFKRHEFVWKLFPSSKSESSNIATIIVQMQNLMAPGLTGGKLLFDFPHIFYMQFHPNARFMYKFKPMVLESISANYVPSGVPAFYADHSPKGNPPEAVEIRCRFLEIEYWLRNQFNTLTKSNYTDPHRNTNLAQNKNVIVGGGVESDPILSETDKQYDARIAAEKAARNAANLDREIQIEPRGGA